MFYQINRTTSFTLSNSIEIAQRIDQYFMIIFLLIFLNSLSFSIAFVVGFGRTVIWTIFAQMLHLVNAFTEFCQIELKFELSVQLKIHTINSQHFIVVPNVCATHRLSLLDSIQVRHTIENVTYINLIKCYLISFFF